MSSTNDRQRIVRVPGSRRVQLTPAPGAAAEPASLTDDDAPTAEAAEASGPNDDRMRREVPPHY